MEFYDDDDALIGSVARYIAAGIVRGEAGIVIADDGHRIGIDGTLSRSIDVEGARFEGLYTSADPEETLHLFMDKGVPGVDQFDRVIGELIERASEGGRRARVFGEMVGLLWRRGEAEGALVLEEAWNRLAEEHDSKLHCAYPIGAIGREGTDAARSGPSTPMFSFPPRPASL